MGDPLVEGSRRWRVLWAHYEAEELRVYYRSTIRPDTARRLAVDLLASGRVPPMQGNLFIPVPPRTRPVLQRFWGSVCQHDETCYLTLFIDDRCLLVPLTR